ncbi:MAG: hypothetical protein H6721_15135 [Sandaracinus sp.]|nr:hypothetical protein [Sandaracinus sp.]MCB9633448.1 hypothetical protein [Sandaracinus sp.]
MTSRVPYLLLALFAVLGLGVVVYFVERSTTTSSDALEPGVRATPPTRPAEIAASAWTGLRIPRPAPADASALLLREGLDPIGRVASTPDVVGLLAWLDAGEYARLDAALAAFSDQSLSEPTKEHWGRLAFDAFATDDPSTQAPLDAWVAATGSWQARLARGVYLVSLGYERRGAATTAETSEAQLRGMAEAHGRAEVDLEAVLRARPNEVVAYEARLKVMKSNATPQALRSVYESAAPHCAHCLGIRVEYAVGLLPRWCGSVEAFESFVTGESARPTAPAHFAVLRAMPDWRACYQRETQQAFDDALPYCDRAIATAPYEMFFRLRERLHRRAERHDAAGRDAAGVLATTPFSVEGNYAAFSAAARARDYVKAAEHLRIVAWRNPLDDRVRRNLPIVVQGLHWQANRAATAGNAQVVAAANAIGAQLSPGTFGEHAPSTHILAAREAVTNAPLDFDAVLALDRQLAPQRRWAEIAAAWDTFLAANPDHTRALLERGGTYYQWGRLIEAERDAQRACELGLAEACGRVEQVRRRRAGR